MTEPIAADLVIRNAQVYTAGATARAAGFAVRAGRIVAVADGDSSELDRLIGPTTTVRDLAGAPVVPGLFDAHIHHNHGGRIILRHINFPPTASFAELLAAVDAWTSKLPDGAWATGGTWGSTLLSELSVVAARHALDAVSNGHPVVLTDDSFHNRFANTAALLAAGVPLDAGSARIDGTVIDPETGETTGVLIERAVAPVMQALEAADVTTDADYEAFTLTALRVLHGFGVTGFQDALVGLDEVAALSRLDERDELTAWASVCIRNPKGMMGGMAGGVDITDEALALRSTHVRPDWIKISLDGVPPTRTAAFLDPYLPDDVHGHDHRGAVYFEVDELVDILRAAADKGLGAKLHCTGDGSVRTALDAIALLRRAGVTEPYQIAHGQFVAPDDLVRFRDLEVIAEISPFLWYPGVIPSAIAAVLPAARAEHSQPNRSLTDLGVLVAGGSDWPVSVSPNLWEGIAGLVTRADPTGVFPGTLWIEQALSVDEALRVFTINAATAAGLGAETGSIEVGKSADFLIVDRDPLAVAPDAIAATKVLETWFAGRLVYEASAATAR